MRIFVAAFAIAFCSLVLCGAETEAVAKTVDFLIARVDKSDWKFVRNGDEHTGKEAAEHMRRKYNHFKKEIKTPEDFIEKCAAKSELSGKPYMVKKPDGTMLKCQDWMKSMLDEHRGSAETPAGSR